MRKRFETVVRCHCLAIYWSITFKSGIPLMIPTELLNSCTWLLVRRDLNPYKESIAWLAKDELLYCDPITEP